MPRRHITLFLPGLLENLAYFTCEQLNTASLNLWLSRSNARLSGLLPYEYRLFKLFNLEAPTALPIAALTALADGAQGEYPFWLRADPVELKADHSSVYLVGSEHLALEKSEIQALNQLLNDFLRQDGLQLLMPKAHRWYLNLPELPPITSGLFSQAIGKNIASSIPSGASSPAWPRLITELQMLLQAAPVNQQRQQNHQPMVNGLWLWGAGELPKRSSESLIWKKVWTDSPLVKGLSMLHQTPVETENLTFADCLPQMEQGGDFLVILESFLPSYADYPPALWLKKFQEVDEKWLQPLLKAVQLKQVDAVIAYFGDDHIYPITRKMLRRWWKRITPIKGKQNG